MIIPMASVQTSSRSRSVSSVLVRKKLVAAFALDEQLPSLLPLPQRKVMRESEKRARQMTLGEKTAQVAMFQLVM